MEKALAALGLECHVHLADRNLRSRNDAGWWQLGSVSVKETGKAYQVFWHPEEKRGWLWALIKLPDGVMPRRFEPPSKPDLTLGTGRAPDRHQRTAPGR